MEAEIRVLHIIPRMVQGGAEQLLLDFVRSEHAESHHEVAVLMSGSDEAMLEPITSNVTAFDCESNAVLVKRLPQIRRRLSLMKPDIVVAWMYHASVLSPLVVSDEVPLVAYIHNLNLLDDAKMMERLAQRGLRWTSKSARTHLLYCGEASRQFHEANLKYPTQRGVVVENGVPLERFFASDERRLSTRAELGIDPGTLVYGCFGRFSPQKNWPLVLDSVAAAALVNPDVKLVAAGRGVARANPQFEQLVTERGLADTVIALEVRRDMASLYDAIDVLLLGSRYGETFPLVVLEALAMGTPVIATGLGSIPSILDGLLPVVEPGSPAQFMGAVRAAAEGTWAGMDVLSSQLRSRSVERFGFDRYCGEFDSLLQGIGGDLDE